MTGNHIIELSCLCCRAKSSGAPSVTEFDSCRNSQDHLLFFERQVFSRNQWPLSLWIRGKFALSPRVKSQVGYAYVHYWAGRLLPPVLWLSHVCTPSPDRVISKIRISCQISSAYRCFPIINQLGFIVWSSCWFKFLSNRDPMELPIYLVFWSLARWPISRQSSYPIYSVNFSKLFPRTGQGWIIRTPNQIWISSKSDAWSLLRAWPKITSNPTSPVLWFHAPHRKVFWLNLLTLSKSTAILENHV